MFRKKEIDRRIDELTAQLEVVDPSSKEYAAISKNIMVLTKAKQNGKAKVNPDTIVTVGGSIFLAAMIMVFEETHVISTKAFPFVSKLLRR